jgi:hypothetical protein
MRSVALSESTSCLVPPAPVHVLTVDEDYIVVDMPSSEVKEGGGNSVWMIESLMHHEGYDNRIEGETADDDDASYDCCDDFDKLKSNDPQKNTGNGNPNTTIRVPPVQAIVSDVQGTELPLPVLVPFEVDLSFVADHDIDDDDDDDIDVESVCPSLINEEIMESENHENDSKKNDTAKNQHDGNSVKECDQPPDNVSDLSMTSIPNVVPDEADCSKVTTNVQNNKEPGAAKNLLTATATEASTGSDENYEDCVPTVIHCTTSSASSGTMSAVTEIDAQAAIVTTTCCNGGNDTVKATEAVIAITSGIGNAIVEPTVEATVPNPKLEVLGDDISKLAATDVNHVVGKGWIESTNHRRLSNKKRRKQLKIAPKAATATKVSSPKPITTSASTVKAATNRRCCGGQQVVPILSVGNSIMG